VPKIALLGLFYLFFSLLNYKIGVPDRAAKAKVTINHFVMGFSLRVASSYIFSQNSQARKSQRVLIQPFFDKGDGPHLHVCLNYY